MDLLSRAHIIKYHNDNIKKYGVDSKEALGWRDRQNQLDRFNAICEALELEGHTLLDVGCANGDLLNFLNAGKINCDYSGIDQIKEFIEFAGEKYKDQKNASFLLGDFWSADLGEYDYVIASGALSYRNSDPKFIYKMIARLFSLSRIAFAFNLLENVELKDGGLVAYDKEEIIGFCKKLSHQVVLKDDYLVGDYTVLMYR